MLETSTRIQPTQAFVSCCTNMSHQMNTSFDNDLDAFLNYDQHDQTPMSPSEVKPIPSLLHQSSDFNSNPQTFSAPSYQYDSHRQQTGLPMGAYANTLAVNQANGLRYRGGTNGFVMPTETLNVPLSNLDDFDFNHSQFDMDMENDSPADVPSMFYGGSQSGISPATQIPPRIYPGMHTQQANQAKMQQAQKQQELMRQQNKMPAGQQSLPSTSNIKSPVTKDPHVEESISRLLNRMRQSSTASAADDDEGDSPLGGMSNLPRLKKDEEEMDEDERLLNSEEGKKLSSKERRQLRNKVSARAFRSRRKGKCISTMFYEDCMLTRRQNISLSLKAKSLKRHKKPTNFEFRTVSSWKRIRVSPISRVCCFRLNRSLASCKNSATQVYQIMLSRKHNSNNKEQFRVNPNNSNNNHVKMSLLTKRLDKSKATTTTCKLA